MLLVEQHIINKEHSFFKECDELCFKSKNLYNVANYIVRQEFIKTSKEKELGVVSHANYLNYNSINKLIKNQIDYCSLPRKVSNQILMLLDKNWKSFFSLIKKWVNNKNLLNGKPSIPNYLHKCKGRMTIVYELGAISSTSLKKGIIKLSQTNIEIPTKQKNIKQCRIVPKNQQYVIEIVYEKHEQQLKENNERYASIDLGINNLATVGSNVTSPIIINGKPLKSINQYYNKKKTSIQSNLETRYNRKTSNKLTRLTNKRNNKIKDYLHKSSRCIVNHLTSNSINTLVIGNNKEWKKEINIGKRNNQNFVNIPHATFINMLQYKCKLEGINVILQEESYTSKCSFLDNEPICKHECYLGKRIKRGLFRSSNGTLINSDVNGSLNILRKVVGNTFTKANSIEVSSAPMVYSMK